MKNIIDFELIAAQTPGCVTFRNFDQIKSVLTAHYFETLSMEKTKAFYSSLKIQHDDVVEFEEIEDGMPKQMKETETPDFDTFVCFDIEHTGTFGAAHGDAEANAHVYLKLKELIEKL